MRLLLQENVTRATSAAARPTPAPRPRRQPRPHGPCPVGAARRFLGRLRGRRRGRGLRGLRCRRLLVLHDRRRRGRRPPHHLDQIGPVLLRRVRGRADDGREGEGREHDLDPCDPAHALQTRALGAQHAFHPGLGLVLVPDDAAAGLFRGRQGRRRRDGDGLLERVLLVRRVDDNDGIVAGRVEAVEQLGQIAARIARRNQRALEIARHVRRRLVAILGIDLQRLHGDVIQLARDHRVDGGRRQDGRRQQLPHLGDVVARLEQPPAGEHLVEHDSQREDVGARVEGADEDLFGRQVADLALDEALLGLFLRELRCARDAEVQDLHRAGERQHDVRGRDVLVDDLQRLAVVAAQRVGVVEPHADLLGDVGRDVVRDGALVLAQGGQQLAQGDALHALHGDEVAALGLPELVDLHDVRVQHLGGDLRLPDEHRLEVTARGKPRQDALQDQLALEPLGSDHHRAIDLRHPALADAPEQAVAPQRAEVGAARRPVRPLPRSAARRVAAPTSRGRRAPMFGRRRLPARRRFHRLVRHVRVAYPGGQRALLYAFSRPFAQGLPGLAQRAGVDPRGDQP